MESYKSSNTAHDKCGTPECCMQCDTADNPKDWYLVAINSWGKTIYNPKTNERKRVPKEQ